MNFDWDGNKYEALSALQARASSELIHRMQFTESDQVLDAGCGVGNITLKVAEMVQIGHVLGIDSSPSMIAKCNERLQRKEALNVQFQVMNLLEIDFTNEFTKIISNSVLHWIKEVPKAIKLLHESLKLGGMLGIQFPLLNARHPLVFLANYAISNLSLEHEFKDWDFPWSVPTVVDFKELLGQYPFEKVKVYQKTTNFDFGDSKNMFAFLDSVGLNKYITHLSIEDGSKFRSQVFTQIQTLQERKKLRIPFDRLYAFGFGKQ